MKWIWVYSTAARLGLGPPEWLVIGIMLSFLLVGCIESPASESGQRGLVLTRKDKWVAAALGALLVALLALAAWRKLGG